MWQKAYKSCYRGRPLSQTENIIKNDKFIKGMLQRERPLFLVALSPTPLQGSGSDEMAIGWKHAGTKIPLTKVT